MFLIQLFSKFLLSIFSWSFCPLSPIFYVQKSMCQGWVEYTVTPTTPYIWSLIVPDCYFSSPLACYHLCFLLLSLNHNGGFSLNNMKYATRALEKYKIITLWNKFNYLALYGSICFIYAYMCTYICICFVLFSVYLAVSH